MSRTTPAQYIRQVRQEISKVTWPSRRETTISVIMVFVMVTLASLFFLGVDAVLKMALQFLLSLNKS